MEELTALFNRSTTLTYINTSVFQLEFNGYGVIACEYIPKDSCIGEIEGKPMYVWDMAHTEYLIIDEDMVMDVSNIPRSILTMMREDSQSENHSNCHILVDQDHDVKETRIYVMAIREIYPGEELVYAMRFNKW